MGCRLDPPVLRFFSRRIVAFGRLAVLSSLLSCTTLPSLGEKYERTDDSETDSETVFVPDWSASLMPNDFGFTIEDEYFNIQGGWYWYDSGPSDAVEQAYVYQTKEKEQDDQKLFWYGGENEIDRRDVDEQVHKICFKGHTDQFLAVGFEVCSTRGSDRPLEFPFPFGNCRIGGELKEGIEHFRGIEFVLESDNNISRVEVQFKEWGGLDDYLPFCVYDAANSDYEVACDSTELDQTTENNNARQITIRADARKAARYNDTGTDSDTEEDWIRLNLSMLQAIHLQVYPSRWVNEFSFCISELSAFGDEAPNTDVGEMAPYDAGACPELNEVATTSPQDITWVPIEDEMGGFEILRTEVTVSQFGECPKDVCHPDDINEWETCNSYYYTQVSEEEKKQQALNRAANCISWCQAKQFCRWIGGDLPSEEQWEAAALAGSTNGDKTYPYGISSPTCDLVVMNDSDLGTGCGVDDNLGEVCTKEADVERLCDMAGNLWEWIDDDALESSNSDPDEQWKEPYKKLKGGSFNSTADSPAFEVAESTIEHPSVPHSPTRIGFRCVKSSK